MSELNFLIPEIFLFLGTCILLLVGVFSKNSYKLIYRLSLLILISLTILLFNSHVDETKILFNSFIVDKFSNFIKVLISIASILILISSQQYIKDLKIAKFEYPIIEFYRRIFEEVSKKWAIFAHFAKN